MKAYYTEKLGLWWQESAQWFPRPGCFLSEEALTLVCRYTYTYTGVRIHLQFTLTLVSGYGTITLTLVCGYSWKVLHWEDPLSTVWIIHHKLTLWGVESTLWIQFFQAPKPNQACRMVLHWEETPLYGYSSFVQASMVKPNHLDKFFFCHTVCGRRVCLRLAFSANSALCKYSLANHALQSPQNTCRCMQVLSYYFMNWYKKAFFYGHKQHFD